MYFFIIFLCGIFVRGEDVGTGRDSYTDAYKTIHNLNKHVGKKTDFFVEASHFPNVEFGVDKDNFLPLQEISPYYPGNEYGPPKDDYGPPKETYGPPKDTYGSPKDTYGPPKDVYGPPKDSYGPPKDNYGHPKEIYGPPKENYGPPKEIYGPPKEFYGHPHHIYGPPQSFHGSNEYYVPKPVYGPPINTSPNLPYGLTEHVYGVPYALYGLFEKFLHKLKFKINLFTIGKIILKLMLFKKLVSLIAILCLLLFLPWLKSADHEPVHHQVYHDDEFDGERSYKNSENENLNNITTYVLSSIEDFQKKINGKGADCGFYCSLNKIVIAIKKKS